MLSNSIIDSKFEELKKTKGEIVDLKTEFTPLDLNSMSKFKDDHSSYVCAKIISEDIL